MTRSLSLLFLLFFLTAPAGAFDSVNSGRSKEPASFLNMGMGCRAVSMGKAFTSIADDASAVYWNPAGLSQLRRLELHGMNSVLGFDRDLYFFGVGMPIRADRLESADIHLTLAVGSALYRVGNIERRDDLGAKGGEFSDNEYAYLFSIGHNVGKDLSLGYTYRYHVQRIENATAKGGGVDIGALFHPTFFPGFRAGLAVINVGGGEMKWDAVDPIGIEDAYEETFPRKVRAGVSYLFKKPVILISCDMETVQQQNPDYRAGIEFKPVPIFAVRAGMDRNTPAMGLGFAKDLGKKMEILIDYGFIFGIDTINETHRLSIDLRFDSPSMKNDEDGF
jgi:hypothetical protein